MYIRDKLRIYTGQKRSVACGPLRAFALSFELRAAPRDPDGQNRNQNGIDPGRVKRVPTVTTAGAFIACCFFSIPNTPASARLIPS